MSNAGTDLSAPMFEVVAEFNVYIIPSNIELGEN